MATSALPFNTGSAFVIRELSGEKRKVTLRGRGLPKRPFTLSGSMRSDLTWYAGSAEGTLQIMGASLDPTTITGKWSDRFISENSEEEEVIAAIGTNGIAGQPVRGDRKGTSADPIVVDGSPPSTVHEAAEIVDEVRRQGQMVEVTWGGLLRRGILQKFVQKWQTHQDLEWEMHFRWVSQETEFLSSIPVDAGRAIDVDASINSAFDDFALIVAKPFKAPNTGSLSAFGSIKAAALDLQDAGSLINEGFKGIARTLTDVQQAIFDLEDTAFQASRAVVGFTNSAKRIAGAWSFLKQRASDLELLLSNVEDAIALNEEEDAGNRLALRKTTRDRRQGARRISGDAAIQQDVTLKTLDPELVRAFTARAGQDLRDIATLHYGTPDSWQALMQYNNLSTSKLEAGQLVFVPRTPPEVGC